MNLSVVGAFTIVLAVLMIGEIISNKTKAFVPSVFVSAILFLIGFWTIMPKDIIVKASFAKPIVYISMYLLLVHMGTLMNVKELLGQWRTVVIALLGIVGICAMTLTVGKMLFGWENVVAGTPPLTGGVVASILMANVATDKGLSKVALLATCMYIMQGFIGYPISAFCLKREAKKVLEKFKTSKEDGSLSKREVASSKEETRKKLIPPLPEEFQTPYVILFKLGVVAWIACTIAPIIHINEFVVCLLCGVITCELGFLEEKALNKANSFGFLMTILMAFIFANLSQATPVMLKEIIGPLFGIIIIGVIGMYVVSLIISKRLGFSKYMGFACMLTALYGFPADYILTQEAVKSICETKEETEYVLENMLPKMLVAGFTTVTIASVIIAGVFVKLL